MKADIILDNVLFIGQEDYHSQKTGKTYSNVNLIIGSNLVRCSIDGSIDLTGLKAKSYISAGFNVVPDRFSYNRPVLKLVDYTSKS